METIVSPSEDIQDKKPEEDTEEVTREYRSRTF